MTISAGTMVKQPVGTGADFSVVKSMEYDGPNALSQKLLETSVRLTDISGIKQALQNGAYPDPRFLDEAISSWEENNKKIDELARNTLFSNKHFLPIVNLLQPSLSGISDKNLEYLHREFFCAYNAGGYPEVFNFEKKEYEHGCSFHRDEKTKEFTEAEYTMISELFPTIRKIFNEKMYQRWTDAPKQPAKLKIERFSINFNACLQSYPCQHYCNITFSNGKEIRELLGGRSIVCLIKAVPHSKHSHPKIKKEWEIQKEEEPKVYYGPEKYYDHFNCYDSLDYSPQVVEKILHYLFDEQVQVESNEHYFDLLRTGAFNHKETLELKSTREDLFQLKTISCCQEVLDQVKKDMKNGCSSLENLENRLLRAYWFSHLKELYGPMISVNLFKQMYKLRKSILSEIKILLQKQNSEVNYKDQHELDNYLIKQQKNIAISEFPLPSNFKGTNFKSTKDFDEALKKYLS